MINYAKNWKLNKEKPQMYQSWHLTCFFINLIFILTMAKSDTASLLKTSQSFLAGGLLLTITKCGKIGRRISEWKFCKIYFNMKEAWEFIVEATWQFSVLLKCEEDAWDTTNTEQEINANPTSENDEWFCIKDGLAWCN